MEPEEPPKEVPRPALPVRPRLAVGEIVFLVVLGFFLILLYLTLQAILGAVFAAMLLAALTQRPYRWLVARLGGRPRVAAGILSLVVGLVFFVPIGLVGWIGVQEATTLVDHVRIATGVGKRLVIPGVPPRIVSLLVAQRDNLLHAVGNAVPVVLAHTADLLGLTLLTLITLFALYVSGPLWWERFIEMIPLERRYLRDFGREFHTVVHSVVLGLFLSALIHAGVGGIGYALFGVPRALLFGLLTFFTAFVPLIGTGIVWIPLGAWLILTGHVTHGVLLLVYCGTLMGVVEYLLRPLLMRGKAHVPDILVLLSIIGGIAEFGAGGLFFGPMLSALALVAVRIWSRDFRPRFPPDRPPGTRPVARYVS